MIFPPGLDLHGDRVSLFLRTDHLTFNPHVNAFILEKICNSLRDVSVFPRDQARSDFDHGYLASETAIHLCKLKADITAAEDNEMRGKKIDVHH